MQPHILGAASTIANTVNSNQGNLNSIAGGIRGQLPGLATMAFGQQPGLGAAQGYASDVLGGRYLNGNPHLEAMLGQTRENVGNQVNSTFSMAGRTGGGNHVERLGQGLATAENQLRYQDYGAERDRMTQAGALTPSLIAAQYAGVQPYLSAAGSAAQIPYAGIGALGPLLGQASNAGRSTSEQPGGWGNALLGAAGAALPFLLSDPRAKTKVKKIGERADGLGVYEYEYRKDILPEGKQVGVMADEVAALRPDALGPMVGGLLTVNYGNL